MKKSYYFSHDYNANNDVKILFLRQQLGIEGYGIYWFIIESLASAGGKLPLKILPVLALQMQTPEVKVAAVIKEFDLFQIEDDQFFSFRLIDSLNNLKKIKQINSEKGKKSAEKRKQISTAVEPQLNSGSTNKIKENKIQLLEIKENTEIKHSDTLMCYNVEEYLTANQTMMESICMKTGKSLQFALSELMKCHLHLEKKQMYPMQKKAAVAWFTSWLINSEGFNAKYGVNDKPKKQASDTPKKSIDEILKKYNS